ncbi:MAG: hypothetical protein D6B27_11280 [Gammaproteobacteria bacterium]|nr:MAG: hypothetical protein D6B27_11280 [Gammaproteobacteria bacterium]
MSLKNEAQHKKTASLLGFASSAPTCKRAKTKQVNGRSYLQIYIQEQARNHIEKHGCNLLRTYILTITPLINMIT